MSGDAVVTSDSAPSSSASRWVLGEWLLLLLAPPAAWWAFGIVLINQDTYVDPWYYLGYGREFSLLHSLFGWRYYVVRFPVMMLNELFLSGSHPLIGYALLRYCLILLCGLPLYAWARRELGRPAAVIGYLFLFCNPLLPRVMLWDLTTFMSVPMALAGMATWLLSDRPRWRLVSGACMMASVASHAFTGTALATFLAIHVIQRLRASEFAALLLRDILATTVGAALCFAAGTLYYLARIGPFDPTLIVTVTASAIGAGHQYAGSHATPFSSWFARTFHIYVPAFVVAMAGVTLGKRIFASSTVATAWWFGVAYSVVFLIYQFVLGRFVLETFYYFAHLTLVVFPLVPVIVAELGRRHSGWSVAAATSGVAALVSIPAAHRVLAPSFGRPLDYFGFSNVPLLIWMLGLATAIVIAARFLSSRHAAVTVLCAFLLCAQAFTFLSPIHRRVFDARHRDREEGVYVAAIQMLDEFARFSRPDAQVIPWHCTTQESVRSITSTVLLRSLSDPWAAIDTCPVSIGPFESRQLAKHPRFVLLLNERPEFLDLQEAGLRRVGYWVTPRVARTIGTEHYKVALRVLEISVDAP